MSFIDWFNQYNNLLGIVMVILTSFLALIILRDELKKRRKLHEEELKFQRQKYEDDKLWVQEKRGTILEISGQLAREVSDMLRSDVSWASDALDKAKIRPSSQTLFAERWDHFKKEKEFIADKFTDLLVRRLKHLAKDHDKKIFLLIDSGTTLYPFFERLGKIMASLHFQHEDWKEKIVLVTNNLPGVDSLMQHGRVYPNFRYTPLAIECKLLPGAPLPVYSAVTGKDTISFLENLKKETENPYLLSLTTGNWIRIRRTEPACPVPLARGKGHLEFKQALLDVSDEIYVISPLGKIFVRADPAAVNKTLNFKDQKENPEFHEYKETKIDNSKAQKVSLVSTSRDRSRILSELSIRLKSRLGISDNTDKENECYEDDDNTIATMIGHTLFLFDGLPPQKHDELIEEFPHNHTRKKNFMKDFFYVDC